MKLRDILNISNRLLVITSTLYFLTSILIADSYAPFSLDKEDIIATLHNKQVISVDKKNALPADISFIVGDIKYNDNSLKFCECGDGVYMSFRAADITLNKQTKNLVAPYWGIFWHYLKQFNLPVWHVGDTGPRNAIALEELRRLGGSVVSSLQRLEQDPSFIKASKKNFTTSSAIKDYKGIIVFRAPTMAKRDNQEIKNFKQDHPEFLYVNNYARPYIKKKDMTYNLFQKAELADFVPYSKIYPKNYTSTLASTIKKDFPNTDWVVVKPVYSSLSCGVNVCHQSKLDDLLKLILKDTHRIKSSDHRCYTYWRYDKAPAFVVASYAPSKTIIKNNKPYDPTMRIVFIVHHDTGNIHITPVAGFWKIPVKSLKDKATLTEQHVTIAHAGAYYSGILTDPLDWERISDILYKIVPSFYTTLLQNPVA